MQQVISVFFWLLIAHLSFGQTHFSFNEGGSPQKDYFSSIPYENLNEKIIIKVQIKAKTYRFILDTGAPTTISTALSEALQLNVITQIPVLDVHQKKDSLSVVRLSDITIGDVNFTDIPTLVAKNNPIFECLQVDGFIGSNLLRDVIVQIDATSSRVILTDDPKKLALRSKDASDLFLDQQSSPIITIFLKNKKKAKEQLLIDLGSNAFYELSLNHFSTFQKYDLFKVLGQSKGSSSLGLFGLADDALQYRLTVPQIEINNTTLLHVNTETMPDPNSLIGSKILHYGVVTIDYKNKKFYFAPFEKGDVDASEKQFPISYVPRNNQLFIGFVWDSQIANRISTGDQIISIDDINYENVSICDMMTQPPIFKGKNRAKLVTQNRQGEKVETIIERQ